MTTSQTPFLSDILSGERIPGNKLGFFRARLSNRFHELVFAQFERLEREGKISRAALARRIGKKPEQITRLLGAPGNWTSDTFSDLLLGLGCEPRTELVDLSELVSEIPRNEAPELPKIMDKPRTANMPEETTNAQVIPFTPRPQNTQSQQTKMLGELPRMAGAGVF